MTLPIARQTCHKRTTLNCHSVVFVYPKALQSSGPLNNRRHAQSHPRARVLTHVTYHPTPAEAAAVAAAALIRFATPQYVISKHT